MREAYCAAETERKSDCKQAQTVSQDERANVCALRTEREANADFAQTANRCVSDDTIQTDRRKEKRKASKNREQKCEKPLRCPSFLHAFHHRAHIEMGWVGSREAPI